MVRDLSKYTSNQAGAIFLSAVFFVLFCLGPVFALLLRCCCPRASPLAAPLADCCFVGTKHLENN